MPTASLDILTPAWSIECASDDPVARCAAQELRQTLQRIGAPPLPIVGYAGGPRIALRCGVGGDGFARAPDADGLLLWGDGPRGLLYAVYDLLEALGCRWVAPGASGARLPRYERVEVPQASVAQQPALPGRCLIIGHDFFLDDAEAWIVWAARNRLNTIFIHTIDRRLALGACHLRRWRARRGTLLPLLRERGMLLELGGHGMRDLVPRRLFRSIPEAFRHNGTRRTPDHNCCPGSSAASHLLRVNGAAFFQAYPEAHVFHLWPDDILGGGWCRCPQCAHLSPADQALLATNALAEALEQTSPQARLAYLAYHDTTAPPNQIAPHPNVVLLYAPRSRSYAHGIGAAASDVNAPFWQHLRANLAWFGQPTTADGPRTGIPEQRVFEYYLDGILFKSAPPPLPTVLREDVRAYRDAGVHTVQALMTGDRPWLAAPVNAHLFARLAWNPEQDPQQIVRDYAEVRAPHAPAALVTTCNALEAAWQPVLDFQPGELALTVGQASRRDLVARPPADVLDYMAAPRHLREHRLETLHACEAYLAEGEAAWREILDQAYGAAAHLHPEKSEWDLAALLLRFVTLRQRLYVLEDQGAARAVLRRALAEAQAAFDRLVAWGDSHLPAPRTRANYRLLRMLAQLQIDAVRDRRLALPWERVWLRARIVRRLAWLVGRLPAD